MDAFISYRRKPSASLTQLIQTKLKVGYKIDAYVDTTRVDGTTVQFPERLMQAIIDEEVFVCLLGDSTLESEWVLKEIEQAYRYKKPCIPVFQESYVAIDDPSEAVAYLLNYAGVHVSDTRIDEAVSQIAQLIKAFSIKQRPNEFPSFGEILFQTRYLSFPLIGLLFYYLLQAGQTSLASWYFDRGLSAINSGNYGIAIEDFTSTIELDPKNALAHYNRCLAYRSLGNNETAILDCTKAIELNPEDVLAYITRGNAYLDLEEYEVAIADYTRAIELDPNNGLAYYNLGLVYYRLGDYAAALANADEASRLGVSFPSNESTPTITPDS